MNKKETRAAAKLTVVGANTNVAAPEAQQNPAKSHIEAANITKETIEIKLPLGRPINMGSERQKRLQAQAEKEQIAGGKIGRGRPKDPNSANALKQEARNIRIAALREEALKAQKTNAQAGTVVAAVAQVKTPEGTVMPKAVPVEQVES